MSKMFPIDNNKIQKSLNKLPDSEKPALTQQSSDPSIGDALSGKSAQSQDYAPPTQDNLEECVIKLIKTGHLDKDQYIQLFNIPEDANENDVGPAYKQIAKKAQEIMKIVDKNGNKDGNVQPEELGKLGEMFKKAGVLIDFRGNVEWVEDEDDPSFSGYEYKPDGVIGKEEFATILADLSTKNVEGQFPIGDCITEETIHGSKDNETGFLGKDFGKDTEHPGQTEEEKTDTEREVQHCLRFAHIMEALHPDSESNPENESPSTPDA